MCYKSRRDPLKAKDYLARPQIYLESARFKWFGAAGLAERQAHERAQRWRLFVKYEEDAAG